jgi:hypothetical protein
MFKMNFGKVSPYNKSGLQTQRSNVSSSGGSNYSFSASGNRQLPSLLLNINNIGKPCGGCGKK